LRQHEKDPQHNDKNIYGFFGVFVCFTGNDNENRKHLFIEVSGVVDHKNGRCNVDHTKESYAE